MSYRTDDIPDNFEEFWDYYVGEHRRPETRQLHVLGTTIGVTLVITGLALGKFLLVLLAAVIAYAIAWISHFSIEGNRPATFRRPLLSFLCDFKMLYLTLRGAMDAEVERVVKGRQRPL